MWTLLKLWLFMAKSAAIEMLVRPPESMRNQLILTIASSVSH